MNGEQLMVNRRKKRLKRLARTVLVVLAILASVDGILSFVLGRMVAAELVAIRARGEPISPSQLAGPPIPFEQNAAFVYMGAFQAIYTPTETDDFQVLRRFLRPADYDPPVSPAQAEAIVARYRKAIPFIRRAVEMPQCRFPVNWEDGVNAMFPHLSSIRHLTQLLEARAVLDAENGRMEEALESIELGFRMSECLRDEPSMMSQGLRTHLITVMAERLREVLSHVEIDRIQARRLSDALAGIDMNPGFIKAAQGDQTNGIWIFDHIRERGVAGLRADFDMSLGFTWALIASHPGRPLLYLDELRYLRLMRKALDHTSATYRELKAMHLDQADESDLRYSTITAFIMPSYGGPRIAMDLATAEVTGSRIMLALAVYRRQHGSYPASLGDLRSLAWDLRTEDPFNGKDFVYRPQGKGFLLYSIGKDLKDDGGREPPINDDPDLGDIVWRVER